MDLSPFVDMTESGKESVFLASLGCSKNLVDTEVMIGLLKKAGYLIVSEEEDARIIIVNTCGFIRDAKEESIDTILELAEFKKRGVCRLLVVCGCLPQRYQKDLPLEFPEVDLFLGTNEFPRIAQIIEENQSGRKTYFSDPQFLYDHHTPRVNTNPATSVYVKIAEGCSHHCSYCIIPQLRGTFRSRTKESVIKEVTDFAEKGIKEINLIAQDTTSYGSDLSPQLDLVCLLKDLVKVKGVVWIRLLYTNPRKITSKLIQTIKKEVKICKYIDLPLQHINDDILKTMRRGMDSHSLRELIKEIRSQIPEVTLRTTMMVGFPGETEKQFRELLDFIEEVKFERLGVFKYSREEKTSACKLPEQIPEKIKEERYQALMEVQSEISLKNNQRLLEKKVRVLIEGKSRKRDFSFRQLKCHIIFKPGYGGKNGKTYRSYADSAYSSRKECG